MAKTPLPRPRPSSAPQLERPVLLPYEPEDAPEAPPDVPERAEGLNKLRREMTQNRYQPGVTGPLMDLMMGRSLLDTPEKRREEQQRQMYEAYYSVPPPTAYITGSGKGAPASVDLKQAEFEKAAGGPERLGPSASGRAMPTPTDKRMVDSILNTTAIRGFMSAFGGIDPNWFLSSVPGRFVVPPMHHEEEMQGYERNKDSVTEAARNAGPDSRMMGHQMRVIEPPEGYAMPDYQVARPAPPGYARPELPFYFQ